MKARQRVLDPRDSTPTIRTNLPWGETPVFANTGCTVDNIAGILAVADGCIVGTHFKVGGDTWNPVDTSRVERFMERVEVARRG